MINVEEANEMVNLGISLGTSVTLQQLAKRGFFKKPLTDEQVMELALEFSTLAKELADETIRKAILGVPFE